MITSLNYGRQAVALLLAGFSLYTAAFGILPDTMQTSAHLTLSMILVFTLSVKRSTDRPPPARVAWGLTLSAVAVGVIGYHFVYFQKIADRYGAITDYEVWLGIAAILVLLEATRRLMGWPLVVLALVFIAYPFLGPYLPGLFEHRGYDLERVISHIYLGADGIFGTPLFVSSTFVILIVIFGAVLEESGASTVLMKIAAGLTARSRGGPAKAAVVGSSLMGMISGTAVANVLTTGTVSIPMMKRSGYRPHVAGAIEAVASTGGQLMPPVMGAAAFIMADITETPYAQIAAAAILPASLFYIAVFAAVHLEAVKTGIRRLEASGLASAARTLIEGGHLLLSLLIFVFMLIGGFSVMYSALFAIVSAIALAALRTSTRMSPLRIGRALINGSEVVLTVALATATAGIIIGVVTLTGLGLKFSSLIVTISGGNLIIALVLTMVASLILGMGLPTAAAYILVATLTAPALVNMGVDLLAAHFFVFYSAMLSAITPPVALAAYAAAGLADADPLHIALVAVKYGMAAFIIPYFFVFDPILLGRGDMLSVILASIPAIIGAVCIAAALQGWLLVRCVTLERFALGAGSVALIFPDYVSDLIGLTLLLTVVGSQFVRWRQASDGTERLIR